ncbi:TransThyretin-Related family domain [Caenorhabditis elegans]|uniref:TransThyretin-Related family domain n=1 Tax=Caenorhabditis elegans TaxID=6239 RepID=Q9N4V1_CAEEL|nr:TransThyretin-Related family domain [Caenorhabditis elegans]CCD73110.1 TransThyretin-Related family domain [Caenorhabditis elegans]|eukprot:NP_508513.1 Uncharacterized protein CELE_Y48D7A.1 [Caenorhabditis elegans]
MSLNLILVALPMLAFAIHIDCSEESTFFYFDNEYNLFLSVQNVTEVNRYIAFKVDTNADETTKYMICVQHHMQCLQANVETPDKVVINKKKPSGQVRYLGKNNFLCSFASSDFPNIFQKKKQLLVSKGVYQEPFVLIKGVNVP